MTTLADALAMIQAQARPAEVAGMARFGMAAEGRLGLSVPAMRRIAKTLGPDHGLALKLWRAGSPEARMVASMIADPERLTERQMDAWVKDFNSWDVCDQVCQNLFERSPYAWRKVRAWARREEEFVKRAAFALIACLAWHDREAGDERFLQMLPLIKRAAPDERNFVKKAVNWALRNIGKRNRALNRAALAAARELGQSEARAARWIAANAVRELTGAAVQGRLKASKR
ncbi:MAG: DNA alkylation repair protein [Anaerolineales bacterium]|nr:DNA alkylation repair protein [Anaerolineales bacterium]